MVKDKIIYTPISYKTWDTLGFFVLYMVLIIAFFYIGVLLNDIKYLSLEKRDRRKSKWSIDNEEKFADSYTNDDIDMGEIMNETKKVNNNNKDLYEISSRISSESKKELKLK